MSNDDIRRKETRTSRGPRQESSVAPVFVILLICLASLTAFTVSCGPSALTAAKEDARERGYKATIPEKRAGCLALKQVGYNYNALSEDTPPRTLLAAADQANLFSDASMRRQHCEAAYARPATDILSKNFLDDDRRGIINACKFWIESISPPLTWREFRIVLTPWEPAYERLSLGDRELLKELGITRARLSRVYDRFGRNEIEIRVFCDAAQRFE